MTIITVTAGHSSTDPGAVNGERTEAEIVTECRNMVVSYLKTFGLLTRSDGVGSENLPLSAAIRLANGADLAIEFHCNASTSSAAKGVEVLCDKEHEVLAQKIAGVVHTVLGIPLRGHGGWKPENSGAHSRLGFISKGGGLIIELFFISNPKELALWDAKKWLVARGIAEVIRDHFIESN